MAPNTCPDLEGIGFCLLCPFFGPAFYSVGMCSRKRFLISLGMWISIASILAALLTRYQATHQLSKAVAPASQLPLDSSVTNSRLWCSGLRLQLITKDGPVRTVPTLAFQAFASAQLPPVEPTQRLTYELRRSIDAGENRPALPLWQLVLPLTPNSSVHIRLTPDGSHNASAFRVTVLRNAANRTCWKDAGTLDRVPPSCAEVNGAEAPVTLTITTSSRNHETLYIFVWSTLQSPKRRAKLSIAWNASRYAQPPSLAHAGPICHQRGGIGDSSTGVCDLSYSGQSDDSDRRVVIAEIGRINRTDLRLLAECDGNLSNYFVFFVCIPGLGWGLIAAIIFGFDRIRRRREMDDSGEDLELSTEFRPSRRLKTPARSDAADESSLLLRTLPVYSSQGGR